jgi:hypothetical protein
VEGQWLPLIGAGFSRNAVVESGDLPPDWKNLGKFLAEQLPDFDNYLSPLEVISAYEHAYGCRTSGKPQEGKSRGRRQSRSMRQRPTSVPDEPGDQACSDVSPAL